MRTRGLPPGPPLPATLQMVATWTRPAASLEKLRRYGRRATIRLPFQPPFVMLWDPDEIRELFLAAPDAVHPGEGARVLEPIVGRNSVILLDERAHLEQRRLLLPAFHGERMQRLSGVMTELAEREVAAWPTDEPVALHPRLQRLTLEIILRAVFGLEQGPVLDRLRDLLAAVLEFSESPLSVLPPLQRALRWTPRQRRFAARMRQTDELIFSLVEQRRRAPEGDDVLAMLLAARHEDGTAMSRQELRDELMTALVAGHETTASQLGWTLERLAREPDVAARLTAELDAGSGDAYLSATVTEILRLRPVLPNAEPRLTKRPVMIGGVRYPAGVILLASAHLLHHDPAIYPEPYAFRPERFLDSPPGTYTWIPFGGGRRRCLGASFAVQEMKVVLRAVLTRFRLAPGSGAPEVARRRSITFSPAGGATVVLHPRPVAVAPPAPSAAIAAGT
ncbi:MAG TPA: cytochrome P450 [Solirubrobacteraceae bacterium]|nr:cytochrome P450 [Solirubrobacteraceae bacterium]